MLKYWYCTDAAVVCLQIRKSNKSKSFLVVGMRLMKVHHERLTLVRPAMRSTWFRIVSLLNFNACNGKQDGDIISLSHSKSYFAVILGCFYPFALWFACCFAFWLYSQFCVENLDWPQAGSRGWLALVDVDSILQSVDSNDLWYPTKTKPLNNCIICR